MMRFVVLFVLFLMGVADAQQSKQQQGVRQYGNVANGHSAKWLTNGVIADSGNQVPPVSTVNGTFVCPTITVVNGIITLAQVPGGCP